jgi:hypothetical protein
MCSGQWKIHRKITALLWMQMYKKQLHLGFTDSHRTATEWYNGLMKLWDACLNIYGANAI